MADLFKSAVSYLSGSPHDFENEFVGKTVVLGRYELKVKKVLGGGGFAYVYVAQDTASGEDYALKRIIADGDHVEEVKREIAFLKRLSGHPNIIEFVSAASANGEQPGRGANEFLILTELCKGGELIQILNSKTLNCQQVVRVFYQTCEAVAHMHQQKPPIIHRDLKVENLLLGSQGQIKLCDFGSATRDHLYPDETWTHSQRTLAEELMQRYTTPMYRTPEMLDLYLNWPITEKADIWALGCLLFMLCFREHPFEDGSKLRILNGKFKFPEQDREYKVFHDVIASMLVLDPRQRPDIHTVIKKVEDVAERIGVDLFQPSDEPLISPVPESSVPSTEFSTSQSLFGKMRSHAGNLLKGIKDTSAKVVQSVAGYYKGELDISYITSRIIVMSYPHEGFGAAMNNYIDDVREFLDSKHAGAYVVYNLAEKTYETEKLHNKVSHVGWPSRRAPYLESLLNILKAVDSHLKSDPRNKSVVVINCEDGKSTSATVVAAYAIYCGLFSTSEASLRMFAEKRFPSGYRGIIRASQRRYIDYVGRLMANPPYVPHLQQMKLNYIALTSVPLFNLNKTGCKPFVEVYERDRRVFTSVSKTSLDQLRSYTVEDGVIQIPVDAVVCGDVIIIVHHVRGMPGARVIHKGTTAVKMFQFQFHTGFVDSHTTQITLTKDKLDGALRNDSKFPDPFQVIFDVQFLHAEAQQSARVWDNLPRETTTPLPCFSTVSEQQKALEVYGHLDRTRKTLSGNQQQEFKDSPLVDRVVKASQPVGKDVFFATLDWQAGGNQVEVVTDPAEANLLGDDWNVDDDTGVSEEAGGFPNAFTATETVERSLFQGNAEQVPQPSPEQLLVGLEDDNQFFSEMQQATSVVQQQQQPSSVLLDFGETSVPYSVGSSIKHSASDSSLMSRNVQESATVDLFGASSANWPGSEFAHSSSAPGSRQMTASPLNVVPESTHSNQPQSGHPQGELDLLGLGFSSFSASQQGSLDGVHSTGFDPFGPPASNESQWMSDMSLLSGHTQPSLNVSQSHASLQPFGSSFLQQQPSGIRSGLNLSQSRHQSVPDITSFSKSSGINQPSVPNHFSAPFPTCLPRLSNATTKGKMSSSAPSSSAGSPTGAGPGDPFAEFVNLTPIKEQQTVGQSKAFSSSQKLVKSAMTPRAQYTAAGFQQTAQKPNNSQQQSKGSYKSVIGHREERGPRKPFGLGPAVQENAFGDILGSQGFAPSRLKEPTSLNAIRGKNEDDASESDPDKLKVSRWTAGKEKNIRALLSSLHAVLWEGSSRWTEIGMHELVQPDQVKRVYKKACLCVHPDKLTGQPQETLARAIFVALNEAYTAFEQSGARPLY
ncbi:cyclin-G-associated kinase-like isoform X2 [Corticium candelabrum]|uniref:cyclin-G-associated kinase-like isoform X2 n=1 Tax=Corticium candelabrum TaxID=121492 RepID=UPI002E25B3CA|nr:cyclin-G-associated kinase-like isoform X2 [Corticium candelabrum]